MTALKVTQRGTSQYDIYQINILESLLSLQLFICHSVLNCIPAEQRNDIRALVCSCRATASVGSQRCGRIAHTAECHSGQMWAGFREDRSEQWGAVLAFYVWQQQGNVELCLVCRDHELLESRILREGNKTNRVAGSWPWASGVHWLRD